MWLHVEQNIEASENQNSPDYMVKVMPMKWNEQALATKVIPVAHWHFTLVLPQEELWNMSPKFLTYTCQQGQMTDELRCV